MKATDVAGNFRHVDLFCGPGGFATGFEWAGFSTVFGLDVHPPSLSTYERNHPNAEVLLADIRDVAPEQIPTANSPDARVVLSAGVPCEGFSMSNRNRTKFTDERNFLFVEFLRFAEALNPDVLLVENVANLARHDGGFFAQEIEAGMADLGYATTSRILDAANFGVPQRRRRLMFVGFKSGRSFRWPDPTHGVGGDRLPFVTIREAILEDLPELASGEYRDKYSGQARSKYARFLRGGRRVLLNHQAPNHPQSTIDRIARTLPGEPMYSSFRQRIRLDPDSISPTIVSGGIRPQFAYGHPTQARGLSIRERARLMSFPDSYEFLGGITQGRVQTGDAVPPILARAVALAIMDGLVGRTPFEQSDLGKSHVASIVEGHALQAELPIDFSV